MLRRFTLVELMIVVAIIAILAAIAVPAMQDFVTKSRSAEASVNVQGIWDTQVGYHAANDGYAPGASSAHPSGALGKEQRPWQAGTYFDVLGWAPDGAVRCSYRTQSVGYMLAMAFCDVDGDDTDLWSWRETSNGDISNAVDQSNCWKGGSLQPGLCYGKLSCWCY